MKLRLELIPAELPGKISYEDQIVLAGSCFAENMGRFFTRYRFKTVINSHGILFNPISLAASIDDIILNRKFVEGDLVVIDGKYASLHHHGKFNDTSSTVVLERINTSVEIAHTALKQSAFLIITFGSAWVWAWKDTGEVVANCHKIPQNRFEKRLLTHQEIENVYESLILNIKKFNPEIKIIFTVSPVRYLRDGMIENNISKSHLLLAAHAIASQHDCVQYFPAYELVIDDLRDYRFTGNDMVHPNDLAMQYVWEKFCTAAIQETSLTKMKKLEKLLLFSGHRPTDPSDSGYSEQIRKTEDEITKILRS